MTKKPSLWVKVILNLETTINSSQLARASKDCDMCTELVSRHLKDRNATLEGDDD